MFDKWIKPISIWLLPAVIMGLLHVPYAPLVSGLWGLVWYWWLGGKQAWNNWLGPKST